MQTVKKALRPKVLIPVIFSVALLVGLLAFGNVHQMIQAVPSFQPLYIIWVVLLVAGYEAVRCLQWLFLLDRLRNKAPRRAQRLIATPGRQYGSRDFVPSWFRWRGDP